jgi:hypothetical protein
MKRFAQTTMTVSVCLSLVFARQAEALVYCVTNAVDVHRLAPTGELAGSGWEQTVPIDLFLGTVIYSNALLSAQHIWELNVGDAFTYEGVSHSVTSIVPDAESDLSVLFFTSAVTNFARLNIETNDIHAFVVLQGRGMERGEAVVTGSRTNGWAWAWNKGWAVRRWGVNLYTGEAVGDGTYAVATFDNNGDPDECMLSVGDSGGPGFIRTGSGWKLATVNYSVEPAAFKVSTNQPGSEFYASLYDCAGLFYDDNGTWRYTPPEASPAPCAMINTRTSKRIDWLTNTVKGVTFPADIGVAWRCETNAPPGRKAAEGLWFEVVVTNRGPYTARELAFDLTWPFGVRICGSAASQGVFATNRWSLPSLEDGGTATLRVDAVVWRSTSAWGTNVVAVAASDKPDGVSSNNCAACAVFLPATALRLFIQ